jgi:predicted nucleic acid-binding protein
MRPYFFDASAMVKLVLNERGSQAVRSFCAGSYVARSTWLSLAEAYGVVKRHWLKQRWSPQQYYRKIFALQRYVQQRIKLDGPVNLSTAQLREARRIHQTYRVDFSDALHIVLLRSGFYARLLGNSKPVLVASDKSLLRVAAAEGIATWNPEQVASPPT